MLNSFQPLTKLVSAKNQVEYASLYDDFMKNYEKYLKARNIIDRVKSHVNNNYCKYQSINELDDSIKLYILNNTAYLLQELGNIGNYYVLIPIEFKW